MTYAQTATDIFAPRSIHEAKLGAAESARLQAAIDRPSSAHVSLIEISRPETIRASQELRLYLSPDKQTTSQFRGNYVSVQGADRARSKRFHVGSVRRRVTEEK